MDTIKSDYSTHSHSTYSTTTGTTTTTAATPRTRRGFVGLNTVFAQSVSKLEVSNHFQVFARTFLSLGLLPFVLAVASILVLQDITTDAGKLAKCSGNSTIADRFYTDRSDASFTDRCNSAFNTFLALEGIVALIIVILSVLLGFHLFVAQKASPDKTARSTYGLFIFSFFIGALLSLFAVLEVQDFLLPSAVDTFKAASNVGLVKLVGRIAVTLGFAYAQVATMFLYFGVLIVGYTRLAKETTEAAPAKKAIRSSVRHKASNHLVQHVAEINAAVPPLPSPQPKSAPPTTPTSTQQTQPITSTAPIIQQEQTQQSPQQQQQPQEQEQIQQQHLIRNVTAPAPIVTNDLRSPVSRSTMPSAGSLSPQRLEKAARRHSSLGMSPQRPPLAAVVQGFEQQVELQSQQSPMSASVSPSSSRSAHTPRSPFEDARAHAHNNVNNGVQPASLVVAPVPVHAPVAELEPVPITSATLTPEVAALPAELPQQWDNVPAVQTHPVMVAMPQPQPITAAVVQQMLPHSPLAHMAPHSPVEVMSNVAEYHMEEQDRLERALAERQRQQRERELAASIAMQQQQYQMQQYHHHMQNVPIVPYPQLPPLSKSNAEPDVDALAATLARAEKQMHMQIPPAMHSVAVPAPPAVQHNGAHAHSGQNDELSIM